MGWTSTPVGCALLARCCTRTGQHQAQVGASSVGHRTLVPARLSRGVEHQDVCHKLETLVDFCSVEASGFVGTHYVPSFPVSPIDVVL